MIILGIDPGIARVGYGVIKVFPAKKNFKEKIKFINCGVIETDKKTEISKRFLILEKELVKLLKQYKPNKVILEKLFFFKNQKTAIEVSQAIGVIKLTIGRKKIPVIEFTPLQVKMMITGYGHAKKEQVQEVVVKILGLKQAPKLDDASDALALAISFVD
ncbi:MAG: crossover junction endodeoxyribonuclease RuvC [bacterium]|nr:crossover junction endodeoxyribonuclease RuvC [bacterium]